MRRNELVTRPAQRVGCGLMLAAVCGLAGCQAGGQSPLANSLFAPAQVPPPPTRVLTPGSAQPYYPGEPPPVLQGAVPPPSAGATQYYAAQLNLSRPALAPAAAPVEPVRAEPVRQSVRLSAVDDRRGSPGFGSPVRQAGGLSAGGDAGGMEGALAVLPAAAIHDQVTPAAWRRPGLAQEPVEASQALVAGSAAAMPAGAAGAVVPIVATAPRVRFPGQSPLGYTVVVPPSQTLPPANVPQTLPIMELPPGTAGVASSPISNGFAIASASPVPPASDRSAAGDGFRPRGSAR